MTWDVMFGAVKMAWDVLSGGGGTKTAWHVLSWVANLCGMFCLGCQKCHGMFCPGMFCPTFSQERIKQAKTKKHTQGPHMLEK